MCSTHFYRVPCAKMSVDAMFIMHSCFCALLCLSQEIHLVTSRSAHLAHARNQKPFRFYSSGLHAKVRSSHTITLSAFFTEANGNLNQTGMDVEIGLCPNGSEKIHIDNHSLMHRGL